MLSHRQCQQFCDDGYTVCPDLIGPRAGGLLLAELLQLHQQGRCWDVADKPGSAPAANLHFANLQGQHPLFRGLITAPPLIEAARQLLGDPLVFLQDQAFLKPAHRGAGTCWHQDNTYFGFPDPTRGVGIWIALHPATIANGTMHVIPGSHRQASAHLPCAGTAYLKEAQDVDQAQAVAIELPPGGALLFNNAVLHCTKDNRSGQPRAAVAVHYAHASQCRERPEQQREVISRVPDGSRLVDDRMSAWLALLDDHAAGLNEPLPARRG